MHPQQPSKNSPTLLFIIGNVLISAVTCLLRINKLTLAEIPDVLTCNIPGNSGPPSVSLMQIAPARKTSLQGSIATSNHSFQLGILTTCGGANKSEKHDLGLKLQKRRRSALQIGDYFDRNRIFMITRECELI